MGGSKFWGSCYSYGSQALMLLCLLHCQCFLLQCFYKFDGKSKTQSEMSWTEAIGGNPKDGGVRANTN